MGAKLALTLVLGFIGGMLAQPKSVPPEDTAVVKATNSARRPVLLAPLLIRRQKVTNKTITEGETLILNCPGYNNGRWSQIQWLKFKEKKYFSVIESELKRLGNRALSARYIQPNQMKLVKRNISSADAGWYACVVKSKTPFDSKFGASNRPRLLKIFHVSIRTLSWPPRSANYSGSNVTAFAAPFQGFGGGFSVISNIMSVFSVVAFCFSIFGCVCCGGCFG